jgi:hypothetical protein
MVEAKQRDDSADYPRDAETYLEGELNRAVCV